MAQVTGFSFSRMALAAAGLGLGLATFASAPALAGDDGAAPIWTGFGQTLGLLHNPSDDAYIEYRERGKLVIPPKLDLPPPGGAKKTASVGGAWPQDPDIVRTRKMKDLESKSGYNGPLSAARAPQLDSTKGVVTKSATAGYGPGGSACIKDGVAVACGDVGRKPASQLTSGGGMNYNPLTWVGLEKKPDLILGPEPERQNLTDPPPGYRAPVEGVGAAISNN